MQSIKTIVSVILLSAFCFQQAGAQQFIDKAVVEYEVKANVKKTMGNNTWEEMIKDAPRMLLKDVA